MKSAESIEIKGESGEPADICESGTGGEKEADEAGEVSGAAAAELCHLANIAYRAGRQLHVDRESGRFVGNGLANEMLTRRYREPYVVPEKV